MDVDGRVVADGGPVTSVTRRPAGSVPAVAAIVNPADVIPHRPPFLLVDEAYDVVPGAGAKGRWHLTGEEPFFGGHFPGRPTLPGVLMIESIAQLGAVALLADPVRAGKLPLFGGIEKARFRAQVVPGDTLELEVTLGQLSSRAGRGSGTAKVNGKLACSADLLFVFVEA